MGLNKSIQCCDVRQSEVCDGLGLRNDDEEEEEERDAIERGSCWSSDWTGFCCIICMQIQLKGAAAQQHLKKFNSDNCYNDCDSIWFSDWWHQQLEQRLQLMKYTIELFKIYFTRIKYAWPPRNWENFYMIVLRIPRNHWLAKLIFNIAIIIIAIINSQYHCLKITNTI